MRKEEEGRTMTYAQIIADSSAPFWAQDLARILPTKDPVDVLNALDVLRGAAEAEWERIQQLYATA
jgi:hypothetical protein